MTTYYIEYYFDFDSKKSKYCYFTSDKVINYNLLKSDEIYVIYKTQKSELGYIMTEDNWELWNKHNKHQQKYIIHFKILNQIKVTFNQNNLLSDDFISYIKLIELGLTIMDNNPSECDILKYMDTIDKYDLKLLTNYFKCKIELDFLQHIKRKEPLKYTFQIVDEIYKTIGYNIIKKNDKLDWNYMQITKYQRGIFNNVKDVAKNISLIISEITDIFGFQYNYSAYITLNYYFKRVLEILYTEFSLLPNEGVDIEDEICTDNELIKQRKILSQLTDWNNVDRLFNILYDLDELYNFNKAKKLDRCCIALLLIKHCPLFKVQVTKPFCKFRKLICEYYNTADVSFKENDCEERIEEVYNQQKGFWRYDTKKNPRQR